MAYMIYAIVTLILLVILFGSLIYLTVLAYRNIHARGDPARSAFPHFKTTLRFFLGATLFSIIAIAMLLSVATSDYYRYSFGYYEDDRFISAIDHISYVAALLHSLTSCALIYTTAHLAAGVRRAASGAAYVPRKTIMAITVLTGLAALFFVAFFIERQVDISRVRDTGIVSFIFAILALVGIALLLIAAITVLVYSYRVRSALRQLPVGGEYMRVVKRVIAFSWVIMILFAWSIVSVFLGGFAISTYVGFWVILEIVIGEFGTFGVLLGIYYLGKMEKGGLWSGATDGVPLAVAAARSNEVQV